MSTDRPKPKRGFIFINNEKIGYSYSYWPTKRYISNTQNHLLVYLPGHGQGATDAHRLVKALDKLWPCNSILALDIDPPLGGDPVKAQAFSLIIEQVTNKNLDDLSITIFGWSHGGSEALHIGNVYQEQIQSIIAVCSAGLISISPIRLLLKIAYESIQLEFREMLGGNWKEVMEMFVLGLKIIKGVSLDFLRYFSIRRIWDDIRWTCIKKVGGDYHYPGNVMLVFGENDSIFQCAKITGEDIKPGYSKRIEAYQVENFPNVSDFRVMVLNGHHGSPQVKPNYYVQNILDAMKFGEFSGYVNE